MLLLLWGLLNITLFLAFVYYCYQAVKLLRENKGWWASAIFLIGLIPFAFFSRKDTTITKNRDHNFITADSVIQNTTEYLQIAIAQTWLNKTTLGLIYGKSKADTVNIPVSAYSNTDGWSIGTNWNPISINISPTADNTVFKYEVYGELEWQLMSLVLVSQSKEYTGFIDLGKKQIIKNK